MDHEILIFPNIQELVFSGACKHGHHFSYILQEIHVMDHEILIFPNIQELVFSGACKHGHPFSYILQEIHVTQNQPINSRTHPHQTSQFL